MSEASNQYKKNELMNCDLEKQLSTFYLSGPSEWACPWLSQCGCHSGRDRMAVTIAATRVISAYHHALKLRVQIPLIYVLEFIM